MERLQIQQILYQKTVNRTTRSICCMVRSKFSIPSTTPIYSPAQPTLLGGRPRKKVHVTDENWISEHAWSCIHYNEALAEGRQERWLTGYYEPHVDIRFWPQTSQPTMAKWVIVDGEGDKVVVDYEMRRPGFSKAGVGIAALLDREGEEWVDDLGLDEKTKRAILHRGREERRWEAQWRT